jgi:hypothetical protein
MDPSAEDKPYVPRDNDMLILGSHSNFGASPFSLGLFHPKAPPLLCHFIFQKLGGADDAPDERCF